MRWLWLIGGLVLVAAAVVVLWIGLEKADQLFSVIGGSAGVVGLAASIHGLRAVLSSSPPAGGRNDNTVSGSVILGPNTQIGSVGGNVQLPPAYRPDGGQDSA
ncbi:hypothetical protein F4560_007171 [Saccharothrix ecbatanensis]|uniref:Uncharacterized protein n=1 Tax=Saccharothrix ecbatanensis TaxID=1105145 RepID=A0A7W9M4U3_9PSEU|nr:hypothetical protein [Saccharothrix ecbatanensis]MBB5807403.1 hypothetical protein [Saccharothrix ecbatanensis]